MTASCPIDDVPFRQHLVCRACGALIGPQHLEQRQHKDGLCSTCHEFMREHGALMFHNDQPVPIEKLYKYD